MDVRVYSIKEVAKMFEVSQATIRREVERGNLRSFKVGNIDKFTMYHLEEYTNVKKLGKTKREMELEEENKELLQIIEEKNKVIFSIQDLVLRR